MEKVALVTINIGNVLCANARRSFEAAAARWQAEYVELTTATAAAPTNLKFELFDRCRADRIFYIDGGDTIIRSDAPSPFGVCPPDHVGAVPNDPPGGTPFREVIVDHQEIEWLMFNRLLGQQCAYSTYFNSGVLVLTRAHHAGMLKRAQQLLETLLSGGLVTVWFDQTPINYAVVELGMPIRVMDQTWNCMCPGDFGHWRHMERFVYHFAGSPDRRRILPSLNWQAPTGVQVSVVGRPAPAVNTQRASLHRLALEFSKEAACRYATHPIRRPEELPTLPMRSRPMTQDQFMTPEFLFWCGRLKETPQWHRGLWMYTSVCQALWERGMLRPGRSGCGFGVGQQSQPALFASLGCDVLATDAPPPPGQDLRETFNQYAAPLDALNARGILPQTEFRARVRFRYVDMSRVPDGLGTFDFIWSNAALEHLGGLPQGVEFVARACRLLRPGGVAAHTTEFNVHSNRETVDGGPVVLFRRSDIEEMQRRVNAEGCRMAGLDFDTGSGPLDNYADRVPYGPPHLKLVWGPFVTTPILLIIEKPITSSKRTRLEESERPLNPETLAEKPCIERCEGSYKPHLPAGGQASQGSSQSPSDLTALRRRARDARKVGDFATAIAVLREGLANSPGHSQAWNDLGGLLCKSGRADEAEDCFRKAFLADPQNFTALENLVEVSIRSKKFDQAAALVAQWTRSRPRCAQAWVAWAKLHLLAGDLARAKSALTVAAKIEPGNAAIQDALESLRPDAEFLLPSAEEPAEAPQGPRPPLPFLRPLSPARGPFDLSQGLPEHGRTGGVQAKNDPPVLWVGAALLPGGYAMRTKQSVVWLRRAGVRVGLVKFGGETVDSYLRALEVSELYDLKAALKEHVHGGVLILHHPPACLSEPDICGRVRWQHPQQLAYVGLTTFETEGLPKHWVAPCHGMDEIWVDSTFNVAEFARGGVDERLLWPIGFGLDMSRYDPSRTEPLAVRGRRRYMFLSVFQWQPRKGWQVLVEAFARTFSRGEDVCLVIKTDLRKGERDADGQITQWLSGRGISRDQAAPILVLADPLGDREMRSLFRAADAFVLPTHGEGWGIPFMEAMAMGLPTLGTRWSGHLDFMNDSNSYLINIRGLVEADGEMLRWNPEYRGLRYADPDLEHLMALMRQVREDREAAREKGRRARQDICEKWTHAQYVERIRKRCRELMVRAEGRRITRFPKGSIRNPQSAIRNLLPVILHGPALDPCGVAYDFRNLIFAMLEEGVDVRLDHQRWNERNGLINAAECGDIASVMDATPPPGPHVSIENALVAPPDPDRDAFRVIRAFWETDRFPPAMLEKFRKADEVWVACSFNADALARSGFPRGKVRVIPTPVALERYGPHVKPLPWATPSVPLRSSERGEKFTFLSCFDVSLRKGWDLLLGAFFAEFKPAENVRLVLNVHSSSEVGRRETARRIGRWARTHAGPAWVNEEGEWRTQGPPVLCLSEDLRADDMPRFYRSGDAYVMPSRGEGWGIPATEAMASGLPVIATAWGGHMDYMSEENAFLVPFTPLPVSAAASRETEGKFAGQVWAEPDLAALRRQMRLAKDDPGLAQSKAAAARLRIERRFSRQAVSALVIEGLKDISSRVKAAPSHGPAATPPSHRCDATKRIIWEGCQLYQSSLALVNRELCSRLSRSRDFRLRLLATEPRQQAELCAAPVAGRLQSLMGAKNADPCDVYVRHGWPPDFNRPPRAGKLVMFQPWEYGRIPPAWIAPIRNQVDEVWAYSRHVFETYVASGISPEKVWLVPLGVNTHVFKTDGPAANLPRGKKFRFLFVGGTLWRKGIDVLLKGYCAAFDRSDDVCLVIKETGGGTFYKGQCAEDAISQLQRKPDAPEVLYLRNDLTEPEMARLYRACHCLVHPYRGEGFGLPVAEAAACGLPVIVSFGGATDDFVPLSLGYFVDTRPTALRLDEFDVDGWVLEPDAESLAECMRTVFENEEERDEKGARLSAHIRENFSWDHAAGAAEMRLNALAAR